MDLFKNLKELIIINSYTKNKNGVDKVGAIFDRHFKELGFECEIFERELIGDHSLYKSAKTSKNTLLLLGHLDTVFPQGKFEEYKEDDKWVYGPGVCDMKGGNIVMVEALKKVKQNLDIKNIDILLVSDEESGSDDSKLLSKKLASNYTHCLTYEAAGEDGEIVTARKGVGTFFIDIQGKAAHAGNSYTKGCNANLEASYKLQELTKLTNLDLGTTLNVGKIEGGIGANTISPLAHLTFEIRYESLDERDRLLKNIDKIVNTSYVDGTHSTLSGGIQRDVMSESKESLEFVKQLEKITQTTLKTEKRGGVSDANILSSAGVITLDGFGPFGDGDHTVNERALKSSFYQRVDLSAKIFTHFIKGEI